MVPGEKHDREKHTDLCNKEQAEYHLCVGMMIYIYILIINLDNSIYIYTSTYLNIYIYAYMIVAQRHKLVKCRENGKIWNRPELRFHPFAWPHRRTVQGR